MDELIGLVVSLFIAALLCGCLIAGCIAIGGVLRVGWDAAEPASEAMKTWMQKQEN